MSFHLEQLEEDAGVDPATGQVLRKPFADSGYVRRRFRFVLVVEGDAYVWDPTSGLTALFDRPLRPAKPTPKRGSEGSGGNGVGPLRLSATGASLQLRERGGRRRRLEDR